MDGPFQYQDPLALQQQMALSTSTSTPASINSAIGVEAASLTSYNNESSNKSKSPVTDNKVYLVFTCKETIINRLTYHKLCKEILSSQTSQTSWISQISRISQTFQISHISQIFQTSNISCKYLFTRCPRSPKRMNLTDLSNFSNSWISQISQTYCISCISDCLNLPDLHSEPPFPDPPWTSKTSKTSKTTRTSWTLEPSRPAISYKLKQYRGFPHFVISQFVIPSIS